MPKTSATAKPKVTKEPGRFRQLARYYRMTAKSNPKSIGIAAAFGIGGFALIFVFGLFVSNGNTASTVVWSITGVLVGVLGAMIAMNRQAEKVAFAQIEGKPGAVGAILQNGLRRGWRSFETPAAVNASTQEVVYRVVGPGGVVLIGEGSSRARVSAMVETEKKRISKIAAGVPVSALFVVGDEKSLPLIKLVNTIYRTKRELNRNEVGIVAKRLETVGLKLPIPKGIDPSRMRPQRR